MTSNDDDAYKTGYDRIPHEKAGYPAGTTRLRAPSTVRFASHQGAPVVASLNG